jgi:Fe-S-cluster containining protein
MDFPCNSCGACCRHLPASSSLNRGDGTCQHYNAGSSQCAIYAQRPLICRVDEMYQQHLAATMSRRVYYLLQAEACASLDPWNARLPEKMAEQLGAHTIARLSPEETREGLRQIMAVATPHIEACPPLVTSDEHSGMDKQAH